MGGEMNAVLKDPQQVDIRYAFAFPDVYEVGMSHLGSRILYDIINKRTDALCERVFMPWVDMADLMRQENVPLFSIETRSPVREFDMLGVTLQYEMSYTNILEILDLSGIPLHSEDRTWDDPIVIAGGPCAFNPEPLHKFIDAFSIGDGEISTLETIDVVKQCKAEGVSRRECLRRLSQLRGVYVPSLYEATYHEDGTLASFEPIEDGVPRTVVKNMIADIDKAEYPESVIVPFMEVVHDRINIEVLRGCTRGCRFCQAGMIYRPVRERSMERILELAEKLVAETGYEEMTLSSLSTGDYSCLPQLAHELMERFEDKRVALSLPSLRLDSDLKETLAETQKVRKSSLTYAMEAGTQRLRDVINKGITEEDLVSSVSDAFAGGWSSVKLYFMFGLPTETYEDLDGIADLANKVVRKYFETPKHIRAKGLRVNCSASCFVPKAFTPFQWEAQDTIEEFEQKQKHLCHIMHIKGVEFNWHEPQVSFLEAVFARGDRKVADALEAAWKLGCRFDGWTDQFKFDQWMKAFEQTGVDPAFYANRRREKDELLPWAFIDAGVTQQYLWRERERAVAAMVTPDCRKGCQGCGLKRFEGACEGR
ncbi:MAG: TIGR03960 family B12-binding radical SAM protein [Clostridia bacterium]|nr:TIGR03960 family B12-binding radical SAM protein [Clostridia bacterium]MBQ7052817.1 TIGR03960 family B12-binding radical SAM protein [Clostridia bacterium]